MSSIDPGGDVAARAARLRDRAEQEHPESWVPEQAGDEIVGELVRYSRGTTSYGEQVIAVLRTVEGVERSVWLLHAVLRGEFAKLRPRPGELVLIRYQGKRKGAGGGVYAGYRVEVDRDEAPPDWDALDEGAAAELGAADAANAPPARATHRAASDPDPGPEANRPPVDDDEIPF